MLKKLHFFILLFITSIPPLLSEIDLDIDDDDPDNYFENFMNEWDPTYKSSNNTPTTADDHSINASALTLEAGPSSVVAGCVNAITGDYFDCGIDLVLPGPQPLIVQHTYCSSAGKWHFSHMPSLTVSKSQGGHHVEAMYHDDNGSGLLYEAHLDEDNLPDQSLRIIPEALRKLTNICGNEISGRTKWANSHIKFIHKDEKTYRLILGSGVKRTFERYKRKGGKHSGVSVGKFRLMEEKTPNGNRFTYQYKKKDHLKSVQAKNQNGLLLATLTRSVSNRKTVWSVGDMNVTYASKGKDGMSITPSHGVPSWYENEKVWQFAFKKCYPNDRALHVKLEPYLPKGFNSSRYRVKTLSAPVGTTTELIPTHTFEYVETLDSENSYITRVRDSQSNMTEYRYLPNNKRLIYIAKCSPDGQQYCKDRFYWGTYEKGSEFKLKTRTFEGDGTTYFCRNLQYDDFGNVTQDSLWGNLTGRDAPPLVVNYDTPLANGCDVYTKTFESSQDGLNLPLIENDGRKLFLCFYFPKTNLLHAKYTGTGSTVLKREYYHYDDNGTLIFESWDDGSIPNSPDRTGVTEWHLRVTTPRTEMPIGLPQVIKEYSCDPATGAPQLISQLVNKHSPEGRLEEQQHYGSDGLLVYTLYWKYDRLGNVTEEINAIGEKITRTFDENGNKKTECGPRTDCHREFEYDYSNRLIQEKEIWNDGQIFVTNHTYNTLNQKIATVDPYGNETRYFYDLLGHLTKTQQPPLFNADNQPIYPVLETTYNAMGQAISIKDANGYITKKWYTIRGQPYLIQYPDGSIERKEYTLDGLLEKEIAKNGLVTVYSHDALGNVVRTEKQDPQGNLLSATTATYNAFHILTETNEAGNVTIYQYDAAGRRISMAKGDKVITYAYDALGRVIQETQGETRTIRQYDNLNRVIEEQIEAIPCSSGFSLSSEIAQVLKKEQYCYDSSGNRTHVTSYTQAGISTRITTYNPHNDPITITDALGNVTHFTYERVTSDGVTVRKVTRTDPLGNQDIKIYDTHGHISKESSLDPFGTVLQAETYIYDASGQRLQTVAEVYTPGAPTRTVTTEWEYDVMGNMIHCVEAKGAPEEKHTRLYYNAYGQKEQITKPNGVILYHDYDLFGRLSRFHSSDNTIDYTYTYDVKDNPILVTDAIHGTATQRSYDKHNRLQSETLDTGLTLAYTYDQLDRPLTMTLPDQSTIQYVYNAHNLTAVNRIRDGQLLYSHQYTGYDQAGNLLQVQLPGQAGTISYQYDILQRLISTQAPNWQETVPADGYDAVSNLLQRQVIDAQGTLDYVYTYDNLYQLTSETGSLSNTYSNDSLYNRVSKNDQPYAINDLNQLMQQTDSSYHYDPNGNLIEITQGTNTTTFGYDALDRLIQVDSSSDSVSYRYDSFHRRLSKNQDGSTTLYIYQKDNEIGAVSDQEITELRILGIGKGAEIGAAVALELQGSTYVPIHDPYGSIVTLLDLSGNVVASYRYTAFGEEQINGAIENPWRYASKRVDPETGFIYFGRRYYMPSVGRWLTPDPAGFADGPNLYTYVHNHPLAYVDPDGQFAFLIPIALSLAVEYCAPAAAAYLGSYGVAGGLAASFITGIASGYNDTVSTAFDPGTYTLGSSDLGSFICSRAGMVVGALISCSSPTNGAKKGAQAVSGTALQVIGAGTVKALANTEKVIIQNATKTVANTTTQKTVQAAEQYVVNRGAPSLANLNRHLAAQEIAGGHAFGKHAAEFGFKTRSQMASHIEKVMAKPTMMRNLTNGRTAFWDSVTGSVIIRNPSAVDGGTAFVSKKGIDYFLKEMN